MRKITLITLMLFTAFGYAQVGINTNTPDASSALEIESTTGGILIPRMTETQRDAIALPASGLMIYQTDEISGFYFYNGTQWTSVGMSGPQGDQGPQGEAGVAGAAGAPGPVGPAGADGADGAQGPEGSAGAQGDQGVQGIQGEPGPQGLAGADGEDGTNGTNGSDGSSAYQIWINVGNTGTESEFLASLAGADGEDGAQGSIGNTGPAGVQGPQGDQGAQGDQGVQGIQGEPGPTGQPGPQGLAGADGEDGAQGPIGNTGPAGIQGSQGLQGIQGETGTQGPIGITGSAGPQGPQGIQGETGPAGPQGLAGADGAQGPEGSAGAQGDQGVQGIQGETGATGAEGPQGLAGADGADGAQGPIGNTGPQGPIGPTGNTGPQGDQGLQGIQGETGATGAEGPQGLAGADGEDGAQGPTGNIGPAGVQGPQGDQGIQGDTGAQGPIGPTGNTGPAGVQGPQGDQGVQGATGPQGPAGSDGTNGTNGSSAYEIWTAAGNTGTESEFLASLVGADGEDGAQGPIGPAGADADTSEIAALSDIINNGQVAQSLSIGDFVGGGYVFWIDPTDNTKGLVSAVEDQSTGIRWFNGTHITTGATGTAIGTGAVNTTAIINAQGETETSYAAGLASAYNGGGYTDWFFPSKDELNEMYINKSTLDAISGFTPFSASVYWTSSEVANNRAWKQNFNNGGQVNDNAKHSLSAVRAIRAVSGTTSSSLSAITAEQTAQNTAIDLKANIASPTFTGTVTTPALIVSGNTYPNTTGNANQVLTTDGSGTLSWTTSSAGVSGSGTANMIAKFVGSSTVLGNSSIFDDGTNVGIGTVSPAQLLHVKAALGNAKVLINANGEGDEAHLVLRSGGINKTAIVASGISNWGRTDLRFILNSYTNANDYGLSDTKMIIKNDGKVGIGTDSPTEKLDVAGNIKFNGALMPNNNAGSSGQVLTSSGTGVPTWTTISGGASSIDELSDAIHSNQYNTLMIGTTPSISAGASYSTGVGKRVLESITSGDENVAMGHQALGQTTSGSLNTAMGSHVIFRNTTGSQNSAFGKRVLENNTTGSNNTGIGASAGDTNTTGTNNTLIGYNADLSSNNLTNATAIGANATVNASNKIKLGNSNVTNVETAGSITAGAITIPNTDGTSGQVLATDGSGTLSWSTPSSGSDSIYNVDTFYAELGGFVIEVRDGGKHGLVVAMQDQDVSTWFSIDNILNDAIKHDANGAKFMDWRLPTIRELELIYLAKANISPMWGGNDYWSSTRPNSSNAYFINMANGFGTSSNSSGANHSTNSSKAVRAVRTF